MDKKVFVVPSTVKRDIVLGIIVAVLMLGFIALGLYTISHGSGSDTILTGTITTKHFTPQPEEQVTVGAGGLDERKLAGEYTMEVYVESEKKTFTVWVDKVDYDRYQPGDSFKFFRPVLTASPAGK